MTQKPIKERITDALTAAGGRMGYHELMRATFPYEEYPKAWRYQSNGGPPGCAMAFGRALRELRCRQTDRLSSRIVHLPSEPENKEQSA